MNIDNEREKFEEKLKTVLNKITGCEKYTYALNSIMTAFDTSRAKQSEAEIASLRAEVEALRKNAERYKWLRAQRWYDNLIGVVLKPKENVFIGTVCPSEIYLDEIIDNEISKQSP